MNSNNTHDTKCESTPVAPPNIKFLMEPMSILANLGSNLGWFASISKSANGSHPNYDQECRLGELGTPGSIHRTGQTPWLPKVGSTEPMVLLVRRRLSPKLARSSKHGSGNPDLPPRAPRLSRGHPSISTTWKPLVICCYWWIIENHQPSLLLSMPTCLTPILQLLVLKVFRRLESDI